jgi:transcriptional regulator with XRE-family HTH domain
MLSMKTIADRLKEARGPLSQVEVARRAKVKPGTIGNIESGIRKRPRDLLAIAKAVGVNPEWLATGAGEMRPSGPAVS